MLKGSRWVEVALVAAAVALSSLVLPGRDTAGEAAVAPGTSAPVLASEPEPSPLEAAPTPARRFERTPWPEELPPGLARDAGECSIYGVVPGMSRAEVVEQLGEPASGCAHSGEEVGYYDLGSPARYLRVLFSSTGVAVVEGPSLYRGGRLLFQGDVTPEEVHRALGPPDRTFSRTGPSKWAPGVRETRSDIYQAGPGREILRITYSRRLDGEGPASSWRSWFRLAVPEHLDAYVSCC